MQGENGIVWYQVLPDHCCAGGGYSMDTEHLFMAPCCAAGEASSSCQLWSAIHSTCNYVFNYLFDMHMDRPAQIGCPTSGPG